MSKRVVVQKYGGSSLSDIKGIQRVAKRIVETVRMGYGVVVVVSAMGNTTNELLSLAKSISASPSKRELDLLVSVGERVSMSLLAMAVQELGVSAKSFTGSQSGIITDSNHISASIVEVRPHRIQEVLKEGAVAIIAGFQGMSINKEVTTLGRGGSDTTAVALTAALGAEYCEICSDVDGVYSTDPRLVTQAHLLEELSYDSAIAMARNGAKVLQVEALEFAKKSGITLVANATTKPSGTGTRLQDIDLHRQSLVIAFDRELLRLEAPSSELLDSIQPYIRFVWRGDEEHFALIDTRNCHEELEGEEVASISIIGGCSPKEVFKALPQTSIQYWWQSKDSITLLLPRSMVDNAVQILHQALL